MDTQERYFLDKSIMKPAEATSMKILLNDVKMTMFDI